MPCVHDRRACVCTVYSVTAERDDGLTHSAAADNSYSSSSLVIRQTDPVFEAREARRRGLFFSLPSPREMRVR